MQSAKGLPAPEVELSALGLLSSVNVSLRNVLVWQNGPATASGQAPRPLEYGEQSLRTTGCKSLPYNAQNGHD